jgi:chromosome segregation ATPase
MTWTEILTLAGGLLGISAVVPIVVNYMIKRHERAADKEDKVEEAQVEDAGKLREELWRELKLANERNDALSTRYGAMLQEKATLAGQLEAANKQIAELVNRLSTEGLRVSDAEDRAKRDRAAREQAEARYTFLAERHAELERDYARIARGGATRKSDLDDLPAATELSPRILPRQQRPKEG